MMQYKSFEYTEKDMENYYLDSYGSCSLGSKCVCLKPKNPWLGRGCFYWTPLGIKNFQEHLKWFLEQK